MIYTVQLSFLPQTEHISIVLQKLINSHHIQNLSLTKLPLVMNGANMIYLTFDCNKPTQLFPFMPKYTHDVFIRKKNVTLKTT
jgi:hypothetical protein